MEDIFNTIISCNGCNCEMRKTKVLKDGFLLRAVVCPDCDKMIVHPLDLRDYEKFKDLKSKEFKVKMRIVGNSYAVSIPKEIALFMNAQDKMVNQMVKLCFEDIGRLSLNFFDENER